MFSLCFLKYSTLLTNLSSAELSAILCQKVLQNKGNGCRKFALNLKLLYGARPW